MRLLFILTLLTLTGGRHFGPNPGPELKVGDQAPDFSLQASDGKTYKLSDFKGKKAVVLAWFPKAYTQGCTIECKSLAEHGDMIKKYNVAVLHGERRSDRPEQGLRGAAARGLSAAERSRRSRPRKAYGVLNDPSGVANRWTFYIGKDGKILAIDKAVKPATSAEDMAAKLGELQTDPAK